ncbi:hypothetical protein V1477_007590 [Vespula maculifrons]|uniref:Uncharacterized protein n=1 Tax=Vespula maculifrons TaxID=7453 RepID=A0ABD2CH07_VESMC
MEVKPLMPDNIGYFSLMRTHRVRSLTTHALKSSARVKSLDLVRVETRGSARCAIYSVLKHLLCNVAPRAILFKINPCIILKSSCSDYMVTRGRKRAIGKKAVAENS